MEIDGKQHNYPDRYESDRKRDEVLTGLGYKVYRIPWNNINKEDGKLEMKSKIDKFIEFYNSLKYKITFDENQEIKP